MTIVRISLPDQLAKEAASSGLLAPERIAALLRQQLREERIARMQAAQEALAAEPLPSMSPDEIQAEIDAYRAAQRASGT